MSRWPTVTIGEVALPVNRPERPVPGVTYRQVGVRLWGEGAYEREPIDGAETKYRTLNRVAAGDIIVNKIWARNGSVSVVPENLDGCFCSGEFPLFRPDAAKLDPRWFFWITKTRWFWDRCDQQSRGTSGKNRLRPQKFLEIPIPLAPMEEQRRVVRKIEQLATATSTANHLRGQALRAAKALVPSAARRVLGAEPEASWLTLGEVVDDIENGWSPACPPRPASVDEWGVIKLGAVSFGAFDETENKALPRHLSPRPEYEIAPGDLLISRANTQELVGASALVASTRPRLMLCDKVFRVLFRTPSPIAADYLNLVLKSPALRAQIEVGATGTSPTMKNISKAKLLALRLPVPDLDTQRRIVAQLSRLASLCEACLVLRIGLDDRIGAMMKSALANAFD